MSEVLALAASISIPGGSLNLEAGAYELERSALEERAVSWRKHTVEHELVEGEFTTQAVRSNVTETLAVWVTADTGPALSTARRALTDALEQLRYTVTVTVDGVTQTWDCEMADYTVRTEQAFQFARTALVTARVPRKPAVVFS